MPHALGARVQRHLLQFCAHSARWKATSQCTISWKTVVREAGLSRAGLVRSCGASGSNCVIGCMVEEEAAAAAAAAAATALA